MLEKQTALITGGSGKIGGAFARELLKRGWDVYLPVRSPEKMGEFSNQPNAHISHQDLEDYANIYAYIASQGVAPFNLVILAAGDLQRDDAIMFKAKTSEQQLKNSIDYHERANVLTKYTVISALKKIYEGRLGNTTLLLIGSHASHFAPDDEKRIKYPQEGYIPAMIRVNLIGEMENDEKQKVFGLVHVELAGLVDSYLTQREFPDLPKMATDDFVKNTLPKISI